MSDSVVVTMPWAKPPLLANDRHAYRAKARLFDAALSEARWAIRAARLERIAVPVEVTLHYRPAELRRRDCDGIAPTLKPILDALVAEEVLADDSWVEVTKTSQVIHAPAAGTPAIWVAIEVAA